MSILILDSFDLYNGVGSNTGLQSKYNSEAGNCSLVSGRFGGQAVQAVSSNAGGRSLIRALPSTYSSIGVGVALRYATMPSANTVHAVISFRSGSTYTFGLRVTTTGAIEAYRMTSVSAGVSLGVTAPNVIVGGTWHYVEVGVSIHDSTGTVTVKVDGVAVLTLTGQDTNNGVTTVDTVVLGYPGGISTSLGTLQIDDLYVVDSATTQGEMKVEPLRATSDVAQGFGRSTGSTNYTLVDDTTANGDTDYVQGSTVGTVDTYGLGDLSSTPSSILAVQLTSFAMKTDAASRSIALQAKSGATTSDGPNFALAASYGKQERILETDPNTGAAWTATAVNALQAGPKVTV